MAHTLAFLTVGILHEAVGDPRVQGFMDRLPVVYDAARKLCRRCVIRSWITPKRYAMTLSVWNDLESVAAFAYEGAHAEALSKRRGWFQALRLPNYVSWWVAEAQDVDWKGASALLDHLHAHGPSAFAFDFAKPFDASGNPCSLDRFRGEGEGSGERGSPGDGRLNDPAPQL
ncbi:MAG TPA: DUF3291 domain-containing protein [Bryobacteraceae bacterium]|jgi:hypothetical protein